MNQHLMEIARHVADNAHAALIVDRAGWHRSANLIVVEHCCHAWQKLQNQPWKIMSIGIWVLIDKD
ncbi:hypothetical protein [Ensifer adhaerens]|uniref:hypothetical protein n=1 Tax=Ensifer adhaerens TaxID=106592 RepID=UPI003D078517